MSESPNDDRLWAIVVIDQQRVTGLDAVAVAIRGWVITLSTALVGIAVTSNRRSLVLVSVAAMVLFATLDFHYRSVQLAHADLLDRPYTARQPTYHLRRLRPKGLYGPALSQLALPVAFDGTAGRCPLHR